MATPRKLHPKRAKTGGRKKGTPNKLNNQLRIELGYQLGHRLPVLMKQLDKLTGMQYIMSYTALARLAFPQLQPIQINQLIQSDKIVVLPPRGKTIETRAIVIPPEKDED